MVDDRRMVECVNRRCVIKVTVEEDIHPSSGMCSACCPLYGPISCSRCGYWEDDDE